MKHTLLTASLITASIVAASSAAAQLTARDTAPAARAPTQQSAIRPVLVQTSKPAFVARHNLTGSAYQKSFDKWTKQGYRPVDISGYANKGAPRFAVIFEKRQGPAYVARHNLTAQQYQAAFNNWAGKGFRLTDISGYETASGVRYTALWVKKGGGAWSAHHGLTSQAYQQKFNEKTGEGYRLTHVSGYTAGGQPRFAAIFEKKSGPAWSARHNLTSAAYQSTFNDMAKKGYRLTHVSGYSAGGKERYAAIWEKRGGRYMARHGLSSANYQSEFENQKYTGQRLKAVSGYAVGNNVRFAAIWEGGGLTAQDQREVDSAVKGFLAKYSIPGAGIAIARNGKLVYARGYGKAITERNIWMNPTHRQRIASVAKPITSAAIMKLVEEGKLDLDDKVFGQGAILGESYGATPYKSGYTNITLRQVLEHTSGLPTNDGNDPMFKNTGFNHKQLIDWTLNNYDLHHTPGTDYKYSNFGFAVLGRVIEKTTGKSYEAYVRDRILKPAGAKSAIIGGNTKADRKRGEAVYYPQSGNAYEHNIARMDAHGGWISSPIDLVRFGVRFDGEPSKPDYISAGTRQTMLTVSPQNGGYAKGWVVAGSGSASHNGFIWGNRSRLKCRIDNICWAVLLNGHSTTDGFGGEADGLGDKVTNLIDKWPAYDLF